ncbi:MAG: DUF2723 domain-containing protein, partial [Rikenellaceae bacterium]
VMAIYDLLRWLTKGEGKKLVVAATVISMSVPVILAAENWDDHDRSHRTFARDVGWNYLQSTLPNSIILNYGDNDTFPLWFNQEVDDVRTDVKIMNTSYLGGEWYIDQMKTKSNEADPVPFSLPRSKYAYVNDLVPIDTRVDRPIPLKSVMDFIRNDDPRTKVELADGSMSDYIPSNRIAIPVNKQNAIDSGIVKAEDAHLMLDTLFVTLNTRSVDKSQLMILDMLANFDWKRPIFFTQIYILQDLGLLDYLQFDGYAYRLVPILTPYKSPWSVGRVDPDYAAPLLLDTFRYGNLNDRRVYADNFVQYNMNASKAREAFARVADAYTQRGEKEKAIAMVDAGLERMPTWQIRFTAANTVPLIDSYYKAGAMEKGDALAREFAENIIEYIEYYLLFEGAKASLVDPLIDNRLSDLEQIYYLVAGAKRVDMVDWINVYYRSLGATDADLINPHVK